MNIGAEIDIARVIEETKHDRIFWCADYFLRVENAILHPIEQFRNVSVDECLYALYSQDGMDYWLVLNTNDDDRHYLIAFQGEAWFGYWKNRCECEVEYIVFDDGELAELPLVVRRKYQDNSTHICRSQAVEKTCDLYIQWWRAIFSAYELQREFDGGEDNIMRNVWRFAKNFHLECCDLQHKTMDSYISEHTCPVCGYYYTSQETICNNCNFSELGKVFLNRDEGEKWMQEVVQPYKDNYWYEKWLDAE